MERWRSLDIDKQRKAESALINADSSTAANAL
jgi:hypothetical protein